MKVELLYIRNCPNHLPTYEMVRDVLRENGLPLEITQIEIDSEVQATAFSFPGSPTVRVDGTDVEPGAPSSMDFGVSCRSYVVDSRRQGLPDREWINQAVRHARKQGY